MLRPGLVCQECARSVLTLPPFPGFLSADAKPPSIYVSPLESTLSAVQQSGDSKNAWGADLTRAWNALFEGALKLGRVGLYVKAN